MPIARGSNEPATRNESCPTTSVSSSLVGARSARSSRSLRERRGGMCCHRRDDPIVRAEDQIVQVAGRDGPEYGQLGRGIFVAEYVQRPVVDGRPSKMRMMEAGSEIGLEYDWLDPGCALFRPAQRPGCTKPSVRCALWSRLGKLPGIEQ